MPLVSMMGAAAPLRETYPLRQARVAEGRRSEVGALVSSGRGERSGGDDLQLQVRV